MRAIDVVGYEYADEKYNLEDFRREVLLGTRAEIEDELDKWADDAKVDRDYEDTFDSYDFPKEILAEALTVDDWAWMGWTAEELPDGAHRVLEGPFRGEVSNS